MEVIPIGSITICTNVNEEQKFLFTSSLNEKVSGELVKWLEAELKRTISEYKIEVISYETKTGCIITPIILGVAIVNTVASTGIGAGITAAAVGSGIYKFITDYDKIEKNLKTINEKIKNLWVKVIHPNKIVKGKDINLPTEEEVQVYDNMPEDLKKLYSSGQYKTIISEKEIITNHKITLMRDDTIEEINKEIIEKEKRVIKSKADNGK